MKPINDTTWRFTIFAWALGAAFLLAGPWMVISNAASGSELKDEEKQGVQTAMQEYIKVGTVDGVYHYYDPVEGKMLRMKGGDLHAGVKRQGAYYTSCADFVDQFDRNLDVDFIVVKEDSSFRIIQGLLHKVDGEKREYDLETK